MLSLYIVVSGFRIGEERNAGVVPGKTQNRGPLPEGRLFRRIRPALSIIGFEERAARWQAKQRASLRQAGKSPSYPDS
jgi:hypothetical protein